MSDSTPTDGTDPLDVSGLSAARFLSRRGCPAFVQRPARQRRYGMMPGVPHDLYSDHPEAKRERLRDPSPATATGAAAAAARRFLGGGGGSPKDKKAD